MMVPGTRVTATSWGVTKAGAVVAHLIPSVVWVVWDGSSKKVWVHPESVTPATGGTP